jgi:hypothetical protein
MKNSFFRKNNPLKTLLFLIILSLFLNKSSLAQNTCADINPNFAWQLFEENGNTLLNLQDLSTPPFGPITDWEWWAGSPQLMLEHHPTILNYFVPDSINLSAIALRVTAEAGNGHGCKITIMKPVPYSWDGIACVDSSLINPNVVCPAIYAPVCGCNGSTYSNDCEAKNRYGITNFQEGRCEDLQCVAKLKTVVYPSHRIVFYNESTNVDGFIFNSNTGYNGQQEYGTFDSLVFNYPNAGTFEICIDIKTTNLECFSVFCETITFLTAALLEEPNVEFTVFPNPVSDILKVQMTEATNGNLRLYDSFGKLLLNTALNGDFEKNISVNTNPNGIYWLSLETDKGIGRKKIIIAD